LIENYVKAVRSQNDFCGGLSEIARKSPYADNMRNLLTLILGLVLLGCNNSRTDKTDGLTNMDTIQTVSVDSPSVKVNNKEPQVLVTNKSDYSEKFIKGLKKHLDYRKFTLKDSLFITDDKDTIYFPQTPIIGRQILLTGIKDNLAIAVTVKRLNYTTVDYRIEIVEFGKANYKQSGQADILSSFFLGSESNESDKTGIEYFVTEFIDNRDNCNTHIRLGYEEETGPYMLGKLIKNCNGSIRDLTLDNFTTLIEK
jgi:hypothetical protein